jgi:ATP-dependent RNA helicase RhlE
MSFTELGLSRTILAAVAAEGYTEPTPIQRQAIPHVLAGRDLVALAQTGTGKTAAFALPILERLSAHKGKGRIRVLVLSPTRELAAQIQDGFVRYGRGLGLKSCVIFGGVGFEAQRQALARGMDIVVATPGRLLDLMGEGRVDLGHLEVFVLDEADRMLDMGFIHDVKRVISRIPEKRQTLLFSATMPDDVDALARQLMRDPMRVAVTPPATTVERIAQTIFFVPQEQKRDLLLHLVSRREVTRALAFTRTKHGADKVAKVLEKAGVQSAAIHGNKSQNARERALDAFKRGTVRVLVATDIAARGIDVDEVSHVVQVDLPEVPDQYVHRIGRTARAGASGIAWAMCSPDEHDLLRDIERTIRMKVPVEREHPFPGPEPTERSGGGGGGGGARAPGGGRPGGGGRGGRPGGGGGRPGGGGGRGGQRMGQGGGGGRGGAGGGGGGRGGGGGGGAPRGRGPEGGDAGRSAAPRGPRPQGAR